MIFVCVMQSQSGPVLSEPYLAQEGGMASLTTTMDTGALQPSGTAADAIPSFALGYDDGRVDVHVFSSRFSAALRSELDMLCDVLGARP